MMIWSWFRRLLSPSRQTRERRIYELLVINRFAANCLTGLGGEEG